MIYKFITLLNIIEKNISPISPNMYVDPFLKWQAVLVHVHNVLEFHWQIDDNFRC